MDQLQYIKALYSVAQGFVPSALLENVEEAFIFILKKSKYATRFIFSAHGGNNV